MERFGKKGGGHFLWFCLALSTPFADATNAPKLEQPPILFILADDLGYGDVGFTGGTEIQTPNLDRLAEEGTILSSFYAQPVCSPTRAALLTGRYPKHTGVYSVVTPRAPWGLPLGERTLAEALREAGYVTAISGKWHLGESDPAYLPTQRGFDHQYGLWFGNIDYFTHLRLGMLDWHRDDQPCPDEGYATHLIAKEACRLIRDRDNRKPLFLFLPFNAVHTPLQVPDNYRAPYANLPKERSIYAGMLAAMDEAIGQVVATLEEKRMLDSTLIVFSSDNGGQSPGTLSDNGPWRAGKGTLFEGGVRVCAFARWPGHIPAGKVVDQPIHMVDWYPTLVKLAGGSLEQPLPIDGKDIWPVLTENAKSPHNAILISGTVPGKAAVRVGDWKLIHGERDRPGGKGAKGSHAEVLLYNLADDPGEKKNLAASHPEKREEMEGILQGLLEDAVPFPKNENPKNK